MAKIKRKKIEHFDLKENRIKSSGELIFLLLPFCARQLFIYRFERGKAFFALQLHSFVIATNIIHPSILCMYAEIK